MENELTRERVKEAKSRVGGMRPLAKLAGMSDATIYAWQKNPDKVSSDSRERLARTVDKLLNGDEVEEKALMPRTRRGVAPVKSVSDVAIEQIRREYATPSMAEQLLRMAADIIEKDRRLKMYEEMEKFR